MYIFFLLFISQIAEAEADEIKKTYPPGNKKLVDVNLNNVGREKLN